MESLLLRRSKRIASKSTSDTSSPMENRLYCRANPKKYNGKESRVENSILAQAKSETPARLVKPGYKPRNEKKSEITSSIISNNSHFGTKNHKSNLETPNNGTVPTSCEYFAPMTRSRKRILESATADNIEVILIDPTSKSSILINANVGEISEMQGLKTVSPKNYTVSSEPKTPLRRSGRVALKNETTVSSSHAKKQKKTNFNNGTCGEKYTLEQQITYKKNEIVMAKMTGHMIWPAKILDVGKTSVDVFFYGDYSTGKIFKSKLMKFEIFIANYTFEKSAAKKKEILRHKGILEAIHEITIEKTL